GGHGGGLRSVRADPRSGRPLRRATAHGSRSRPRPAGQGVKGGMEPTLGGLVVLALVDSTSAGTLGIPVWMLARPRIRVRPVLGYLATIALFYWLLGLVLLLGLEGLTRVAGQLEEHPVVLWGQLVVGLGLLALSFLFDEKPAARR